MSIFYKIFKKRIDTLAEEKLKDIALDEYINRNFFVCANNGSVDLQFQGRAFIKHITASVYEIVKDSDNYVTLNLECNGYEPMEITIQKKRKLSPHAKMEKIKKVLQEVVDHITENNLENTLLSNFKHELKESGINICKSNGESSQQK